MMGDVIGVCWPPFWLSHSDVSHVFPGTPLHDAHTRSGWVCAWLCVREGGGQTQRLLGCCKSKIGGGTEAVIVGLVVLKFCDYIVLVSFSVSVVFNLCGSIDVWVESCGSVVVYFFSCVLNVLNVNGRSVQQVVAASANVSSRCLETHELN